jgi:hypothetical protein
MPCSLHKILVHGSLIMNSLDLPIGAYSEEAQECRNKDNKSFRLNHARKDSRKHTFQDQINYLCATSDPYISDLIIKGENKQKELKLVPTDVIQLIKQTNGENFVLLESESSTDESSLTSDISSDSDDENEVEMSQKDENNNENMHYLNDEIEEFPEHF